LELIKKGYIEPALHNGESNFSGFARLCGEYFEIETTPSNLQRVLQEGKNRLSQIKREKFRIPELNDLA
jgi:hypothetical protein